MQRTISSSTTDQYSRGERRTATTSLSRTCPTLAVRLLSPHCGSQCLSMCYKTYSLVSFLVPPPPIPFYYPALLVHFFRNPLSPFPTRTLPACNYHPQSPSISPSLYPLSILSFRGLYSPPLGRNLNFSLLPGLCDPPSDILLLVAGVGGVRAMRKCSQPASKQASSCGPISRSLLFALASPRVRPSQLSG